MHDHMQTAAAEVPGHMHGAPPAPVQIKASKGPTSGEDLLKGLWKENPVLVQLLGLCPTLAVTNSVMNAVTMGVATLFVLVFSSLFVSSLRKLIPNEVRISTYVLIIATFVTIADMGLEALVPETHKALGAFIALIVVNCIILGRQEAFSAKNTVWRSVLDAFGMGAGFTVTLLMMGTVREALGSGTILGVSIFGSHFEPWVIMVLPPGGFLTLGGILLGLGWWKELREKRDRALAARALKGVILPVGAPAGPAKVA